MSFHKKPVALSLKQSSAFGKLPSDAIVGVDRRDLPPSLRRGTTGVGSSTAAAGPAGRSVPSYMQGTQTSQRKDIGMNVRRPAKASERGPQPRELELLKGYGAPKKLPALYERAQQSTRPGLPQQTTPGETATQPPQSTAASSALPRPYAPLQLGKSREATAKEVQQITTSCRYVRRKGSLIDPPSFYYKR